MGAGFIEGDTIPSNRQLAGADSLGVCFGVNRINVQRHRNYAVATIDCLKDGGLGASFVEGNTIPSIGQLAGANGLGVGFGIDRINRQSHRNHRVATIDCLKGGGLGASFVEGNTIPSIGQLAGADSLGVGFGIDRINRQRQGNDGVTTHNRTSVEHILPANCSHLKDGITPCIRQLAGANDRTFSLGINRSCRHIPNHNAITTRNCGQCIGIGTRSCHFVSIEIKATAFTESHIQTGNRCNMLYNLIQGEALLE